ncbi:MAG: hypothetical protein JNN15_14010 [Blastocatellia bacterium]|nr:hypothetical protein [Blastocatellia bacterium]
MQIDIDNSIASIATIKNICAAVKQEGGRAFLVGGLVRDSILAKLNNNNIDQTVKSARDFDIEVYGIDGQRLKGLITKFGRVNTVGEAFTIYKLAFGRNEERFELDISLPRHESKTGYGHKGFTIVGDPYMSVEAAARRRDFTINAIMYDLLTAEVVDPYHGIDDLKSKLLKVVDPKTFVEDSLRVLRAVVFAARFDFSLASDTINLCRSISLLDLPSERIWGEIEKLLLRATRPSIGLEVALEIGVVDQLFPELKSLIGCPQEPEWHPEGDVWIHTLQAVDEAVKLIVDLTKPKKLAVMLAELCHDFGKPSTTEVVNGRIRSLAHEEAGVAPTERFLNRLGIFTLDGYKLRDQIIALVANHLKPGQFFYAKDRLTDGAFRRLARKCELDLLYRVAKADSLGRHATGHREPDAEAQEWFIERVHQLGVESSAPEPILLGRHLLTLGLSPGPEIGRITKAVYEMQLDGDVQDLEQALSAAKNLLTK